MVSAIAWIDGDAPGTELIAAARAVFETLGLAARYEAKTAKLGWDLWATGGKGLPDETVAVARGCIAVFVGAVANGPQTADPKAQNARAAADPAQATDPVRHLARKLGLGLRLVEMRRYALNTEAFELALVVPEQNAAQTESSAARLAFETARTQGRPTLTVLQDRESQFAPPGPLAAAARGLAREFPEVQLRESEVQSFCSGLLEKPGLHGAVLCMPQLAPAIAAIGAHLAGGAFACAASFRSTDRACFTPLLPAQRSFAGKGHASPVGIFQALRSMLSFLGETAAAARLEGTIAWLLAEGPKTLEQGGDASLEAVTQAAQEHLGNP